MSLRHMLRKMFGGAPERAADARALSARRPEAAMADTLPKLTRPFFRGDAARTAATGAGLGLAIVEKTIQRMGGIFGLANTASGGLSAHIKLRRS